mgnify:CR=1 FL=1
MSLTNLRYIFMKVKILMTKVITISTRGSLAGRTTMCSQETRTRVQRTFAILVSAEIERSVAIGSYYQFSCSLCWITLWAKHCAV